MPEQWKDVKGYEKFYLISDFGNIFSIRKNRILHPRTNCKNGYKQILLTDGKSKKMFYIHRLVAQAFLINEDKSKTFVNHKNENKLDNRCKNLEWCTKEYNNKYNGKDQKSCKPIKQLSKSGNLIKIWSSAREASRTLNIEFKNISAVANNKRNFCGGYRWEFAV